MMRSINIRKKPFFFILLIVLASITFIYAVPTTRTAKKSEALPAKAISKKTISFLLYDSLNLDALGLSKDAFMYAIQGMQKLESAGVLKNDSIISIVDFSLPSYLKRLFIIDL